MVSLLLRKISTLKTDLRRLYQTDIIILNVNYHLLSVKFFIAHGIHGNHGKYYSSFLELALLLRKIRSTDDTDCLSAFYIL